MLPNYNLIFEIKDNDLYKKQRSFSYMFYVILSKSQETQKMLKLRKQSFLNSQVLETGCMHGIPNRAIWERASSHRATC